MDTNQKLPPYTAEQEALLQGTRAEDRQLDAAAAAPIRAIKAASLRLSKIDAAKNDNSGLYAYVAVAAAFDGFHEEDGGLTLEQLSACLTSFMMSVLTNVDAETRPALVFALLGALRSLGQAQRAFDQSDVRPN